MAYLRSAQPTRRRAGAIFEDANPSDERSGSPASGKSQSAAGAATSNNGSSGNMNSSFAGGASPTSQFRPTAPQPMEWLRNCEHFSESRRFRPSETWAAISPKLPRMDALLASHHAAHGYIPPERGASRSASMLAPAGQSGGSWSDSLAHPHSQLINQHPQFQQRSATADTNDTDATETSASISRRAADSNPFGPLRGSSVATGASSSPSTLAAEASSSLDDDDSWAMRRLVAIVPSTSNPHSQRLFSRLEAKVPERL